MATFCKARASVVGGALSPIGAFNTENPANPASVPIFLAITR